MSDRLELARLRLKLWQVRDSVRAQTAEGARLRDIASGVISEIEAVQLTRPSDDDDFSDLAVAAQRLIEAWRMLMTVEIHN
jgi:hypothetical protein